MYLRELSSNSTMAQCMSSCWLMKRNVRLSVMEHLLFLFVLFLIEDCHIILYMQYTQKMYGAYKHVNEKAKYSAKWYSNCSYCQPKSLAKIKTFSMLVGFIQCSQTLSLKEGNFLNLEIYPNCGAHFHALNVSYNIQ